MKVYIVYIMVILFIIATIRLVIDYHFNSKHVLETENTSNDYGLDKIIFEKEIPKIIYKTHENLENINNFTKELEITKKYTKNFEHKFFTSEDRINFVKQNYSNRIFNAFTSIDDNYGACKADFFRYLLIYKLGGIYLDIKSVVCGELDKIIEKNNDKLIVSYSNNPFNNPFNYYFFPSGELIQWCVISPKGHPVLKKIISEITYNIELELERKNKKFRGGHGVLSLSGPVLFTRIVNQHLENNVKIINKNFNGCVKKYINKNYKKKYKTTDYWSCNKEIIRNK